jgi:energy-coupling factor transporter ATP-binding protein EcfA2
MKRITAIEIENYRAFYQQYEPIILPKGENLLLYGENGSGKSSLFKALSNYFSSSKTTTFPFSKNHHSLAENGLIQITFDDYDLATNSIILGYTQQLSFSSVTGASTNNVAFIKDTEFIKGFLDYRNLLDIYNHKEDCPNLFNLIVTELLLHYTPAGGTYAFGERWLWLIPEMRDVRNRNTLKHRNAKDTLPSYQASLEESLRRIFLRLNKLLMKYFNFNLRVWFTLQPIIYQYDLWNWHPTADLRLDLKLNGITITNQQDYLNEARLSALSVCLYLAAVLQNPSYMGFDYKILFLDDIFVGLDAGNRIPILNILKDNFTDYQIFISTYDRHWFELAKNHFEVEAPEKWKTMEFYVGKDTTGIVEFEKPIVVKGETNFELAVRYLNHRSKPDYPAAANYFRKALEQIIHDYVPKYEKTNKEFTQIPDYKLTSLVLATKFFLHKIGNSETHINAIAGLLSGLMHPLSHHQISSPVYKGELQILQTAIPKLKEQLILIDHTTNFRCMLESKKHLKFTFKINTAINHFIYYEFVLQENLLKKFNSVGLPNVSLCKCRATGFSGTNNGTPIAAIKIGKNNPLFNYDSLNDAYNKIHAYLVTQDGAFPREINYLDAIQYHNGTSWAPITTILSW